MPTLETERRLSVDATRDRASRSHRFVGFDPPYGAPPEVAEEAVLLLQQTPLLRAF